MSDDRRMLTVNTDLAGGAMLVAIAVVALLAAREATFNVWVFPRVTAVFLAVVGTGLLVKGFITPDYREVLDLRFLKGYALAEVAATMRRSPAAVQMLSARALRQLRAAVVRLSDLENR